MAQIATRIIVLNAQYMALNVGVEFDKRERVKVLVSLLAIKVEQHEC